MNLIDFFEQKEYLEGFLTKAEDYETPATFDLIIDEVGEDLDSEVKGYLFQHCLKNKTINSDDLDSVLKELEEDCVSQAIENAKNTINDIHSIFTECQNTLRDPNAFIGKKLEAAILLENI